MAWLHADGAEIALGISALFLVAAWAMHRVIRKVLMATPPKVQAAAEPPSKDSHV